MGWFHKETYLPTGIVLHGSFDSGWALDYHSAIQNGVWKRTTVGDRVYRFKYRGQQASGRWLVKVCLEFLKHLDPLWEIDVVLAVPPSRPRHTLTAAEFIAKRIAHAMAVPFLHREPYKSQSTRFMKHAESNSQKHNIINHTMAIHHPEVIKDKHILLIDDLIKSGITCHEAVRAIKTAHPNWIGFLL